MCQTYDVCFIFNLGNKNLGIYHHFSLILCYFWRQNCLKTSILALWATLVNTCWPYVCDRTKWSLGACKYLSQVPSPQISRQEIQNSSRGVEKTIFLCLQWVDGITTFKSCFLPFLILQKMKNMFFEVLYACKKCNPCFLSYFSLQKMKKCFLSFCKVAKNEIMFFEFV